VGNYTAPKEDYKQWFLTIHPDDTKKKHRPLSWYNHSMRKYVKTDWLECLDTKHKRPYYYNKRTKKSQWSTPSPPMPKDSEMSTEPLDSSFTLTQDIDSKDSKKPNLAHLVSFAICTSTKQFHIEHQKKFDSRKYKDEPERVNYEEVMSMSQMNQKRDVKVECYSGT